jgi:hypothetical protein
MLPPPPPNAAVPQEPPEEVGDEAGDNPNKDADFSPPMPAPDLGDSKVDDNGDGHGCDSSRLVPLSNNCVDENEESTDEGEVTPISLGVLHDEVVYQIPFRDKLQNFGF